MSSERRYSRRELVGGAATGAAAVLVSGAFGPSFADAARAAGEAEAHGVHRFTSRPDLTPPVVSVVSRNGSVAPGYLFLAPSSGPGQRGPLIVDNRGTPVWCLRTKPAVAMNFRAAVYRGKPVLTWWEGKTEHGLGEGAHVIVDSSYREVERLPAANGRPSDLHEFLLTPHGTALVSAWEKKPMNLSAIGGPANGSVIGGVVQELELPSGRLLFEWRSLDHVTLDESHAGVSSTAAFDYFHVNSIDLDRDGNLLVSARNTWAIYKIDRGSGDVIWRLGGKKSSFSMGAGAGFAWQHDARHHGPGDHLVSLFDDGAAPQVQPQSKGLVLALDMKRMHASLHRSYTHRPPLLAHALGSVQLLPNGNVLVGWGTAPYLTEFAATGRVLLDARLPRGGQNYRTLRFPWSGTPAVPPDLAARRTAGGHLLCASWNGATGVAAWQLETGTRADELTVAATIPTQGFETVGAVPAAATYAVVTALDGNGRPLGRSKVIGLA